MMWTGGASLPDDQADPAAAGGKCHTTGAGMRGDFAYQSDRREKKDRVFLK